jgi:transcriptional regulator with XRE-family HTH domain
MRFKEMRESRKLKQQQVADFLEIPLRTYQNYERGVNEPDHLILCKLADFYDVSIDYLIDYSDISISIERLGISKDEIAIINFYRSLTDMDKAVARRVICALSHINK